MSEEYYKKCEVCGADIHMNFFCSDCPKKIDPWGVLIARYRREEVCRNALLSIEKVIAATKIKSAVCGMEK